MSKRTNNAESTVLDIASSPDSPEAPPSPVPHKRLKTGIEDALKADSSDSNSGDQESANTVEKDDPTIHSLATRDPDYYFDDGSVILRVRDVLFKIHASLIKARSTVFRDMFDMPLGNSSNKPTEGSCDERPIVIPGIEPSQFQNLMKMFYCPPSDKLFVGLQNIDRNDEEAWNNFQFLLDVARLCHRFDMDDMGTWAIAQLLTLLRAKTEAIADQLRVSDVPCSCFLDALWHAKIASLPRLARDARYMIQYYCSSPRYFASTKGLVSLFKAPNLRQNDAHLFGFIFLILLSEGHQVWQQDLFTQMDRMAFFSAQSYLTPLPDTLTGGMITPLFIELDSPVEFSKKFTVDSTKKTCIEKCHKTAFLAWQEAFDDYYYQGVTGQQALVPIHTLTSLHWRRLQFAKRIRTYKCAQWCFSGILDCLDRDLGRLYTRLAGYYQGIQ